jgi:uncharacterized membrane protein
MHQRKSAQFLALLGMLVGIEILLAFTPLGFIPLGFTKATTIHIPVIIGAIFLGPTGGVILGGIFGILSIISNTLTPTLTSFVFSPFVVIGDIRGNLASVIVAILPRMMIGFIAAYTYKYVKRIKQHSVLPFALAGIIGSLTNTFLVMLGIYLFFGQQYAMVKNIPLSALFGVIMGIIGINGIPEAIVAGMITVVVGRALKNIFAPLLREKIR